MIDGQHVNIVSDQNRYRGGAIYIECVEKPFDIAIIEEKNETNCQTKFDKNNTFVNNFAQVQGGAISIFSAGFDDLDNSTIFKGNKAGYHSDSISLFTTQFVFNDEDSIMVTLNESMKDFYADEYIMTYELVETLFAEAEKRELPGFLVIASGQKLRLQI